MIKARMLELVHLADAPSVALRDLGAGTLKFSEKFKKIGAPR